MAVYGVDAVPYCVHVSRLGVTLFIVITNSLATFHDHSTGRSQFLSSLRLE